MEDASDTGFEVVTSEGSGAEQSPASSQGKAPVSTSPEITSVTNENEVRNSDREEQTSQNSVLPENTANETDTGKEVVKMLSSSVLKRYFFFNLVIASCNSRYPHSVYACWDLVLK